MSKRAAEQLRMLTSCTPRSVTYNVVGHVKTLIVLAGGYLFFGESMPLNKALGEKVSLVVFASRQPHHAMLISTKLLGTDKC